MKFRHMTTVLNFKAGFKKSPILFNDYAVGSQTIYFEFYDRSKNNGRPN